MSPSPEADPREPEEKDEKVSDESLAGDEEKAAPAEQELNTDPPAQNDETKPAPPPSQRADPPPNGGNMAWLQVVGGFMLFFNTFGILKCVMRPASCLTTSITSATTNMCPALLVFTKHTTKAGSYGRRPPPTSPGSAQYKVSWCCSWAASAALSSIEATLRLSSS